MKVLFDQATPVPLRFYLKGHEVRTAAQQGWDRLKNGELLAEAEAAGFDLLVTTDRNLQYQQNLTGRRIAIAVLSRQQWPELKPHAEYIAAAIDGIQSGVFLEIEVPHNH